MNRVDRLMAMVLHLQSRRVVRAEDLAAHFEISVRTVYRDLDALAEAGVPIVAEAGVGYSLLKGYHLPPVMFTAEEAAALCFGEKLVEQFTDASLRRQMEGALLKIRSVLPRDHQDHLDRLGRTTIVVSRPGDTTPRLNSGALTHLQRAVAERRVIALDYRGGARQEVTRRAVEPLGLVYYANNWHLIAHCRLRGDMRDFRTDRIQRLEILEERFNGHDDFSLSEFLKADNEAGGFPMARVRFDHSAMERVRRERFWGLVEEKVDETSVEVTVLDCSHDHLAAWVLSFGPAAEVKEPFELRRDVAALAEETARFYRRSPDAGRPESTIEQSLVEAG